MMLGFPSTRFTTSCSKPEDFVNTSTDFGGAAGRRFASASPAPVTAAVRRNSLRPVIPYIVVLLNLPSVVAFGMRAAGKRREGIIARPAKFAHAHFRRIIRAADPAFQIFEMAVQRRLFFPSLHARKVQIFRFCRRVGQIGILLL